VLEDLLKHYHLEQLSELLIPEIFEKDEVIVREGEASEVPYIIETGTVEMFTKAAGSNPVGTLSSSEYFGHNEVGTSSKRTATCKAVSQVK
jgi:CRP-like cAMP-binding protein